MQGICYPVNEKEDRETPSDWEEQKVLPALGWRDKRGSVTDTRITGSPSGR